MTASPKQGELFPTVAPESREEAIAIMREWKDKFGIVTDDLRASHTRKSSVLPVDMEGQIDVDGFLRLLPVAEGSVMPSDISHIRKCNDFVYPLYRNGKLVSPNENYHGRGKFTMSLENFIKWISDSAKKGGKK